MTKLFDLGGEGAASSPATAQTQFAQRLLDCDPRQPTPIHGRIALGVVRVEEIPVLDEEQGFHQHRRNGIEIRVLQARVLARIEGLVVAVEDGQAGTGFLPVYREVALVDEVAKAGGLPRLGTDVVAGLGQAGQEGRQLSVAEALFVRAGVGDPEVLVGAGLERPGGCPGPIVEISGLKR